MDNYKKELVARIEQYILTKGYTKNDWYHGIYYRFPDGRDLKAISWDNQTENRGKMFFDCFENYMRWGEKHTQPLAEDCSVEVLKAICDKYNMPLYSGFITEKIWDEIPILDWNEMTHGQMNMHLEIVHTRHLHDNAMLICRKKYPSVQGRFAFLNDVCKLFDAVIKQLYKETNPDKPECLVDESVISLMGGLKSGLHTIMQL